MWKGIFTERFYKILMLVTASTIVPGFVMRCDKAALNLQRGFFEGIGFAIAQFLVDATQTGV